MLAWSGRASIPHPETMNICTIYADTSEMVPPARELDTTRMVQRTHVQSPVIHRGSLRCESHRRSRRRLLRSVSIKQISAFIVVALFASGFALVLSSLPSESSAFNLRAPILILSDADFTPSNGVVDGSGTADDPYIISGWEIPVSSGTGIFVAGTTAYFAIVGCHINGTAGMSPPVYAIHFNGVGNGTVKECTFNNTNTAVWVQSSEDCVIQENDVLGNMGWAMVIEASSRVNVVSNYFLSQNGIQGSFWFESSALLNEFLWNEVCIGVNECDYLVIQENSVESCGRLVSAGGCDYLQVLGNAVNDAWSYGIEFSGVTHSEVRGNSIEGCLGSGMSIFNSNTLTIHDNVVNGSMIGGFVVMNCEATVIRDNVISNNSIGFGFFGGGITLITCTNLTMYHNNFMTNTPAQVQDDRGMENHWNSSYPEGGNYWSDYVGVDISRGPDQIEPGSDGIGDMPYIIDPDSRDFYPLMGPFDFNPGPVAVPIGVPLPANISMDVTFDGSGSYHPSAPRRTLTGYRWDFDCDGRFDTGWSSDPTSVHRFPRPGNHTVVLEVMDSEGLTDMTTLETYVYLDEIPEFPVVVLPVIAVLAIVALSQRRRSGNR